MKLLGKKRRRRIKLFMGSPIKGDSGIARLSAKTMDELNVKEGGQVVIAQDLFDAAGVRFRPSFRIAKALPEDEAKNMIRVGEEDFKKYKYEADVKTTVIPV